MKTSQDFQKVSAGVSLFILALGFSSIGLMSLIHQPLSDDSLAFSAMSSVIGGWASIAVASVFIFAALLHLRRDSWRILATSPQIPRLMQNPRSIQLRRSWLVAALTSVCEHVEPAQISGASARPITDFRIWSRGQGVF